MKFQINLVNLFLFNVRVVHISSDSASFTVMQFAKVGHKCLKLKMLFDFYTSK